MENQTISLWQRGGRDVTVRGASLRPKADHAFSGTTCQHQVLVPTKCHSFGAWGSYQGAPPRLIQADGSR